MQIAVMGVGLGYTSTVSPEISLPTTNRIQR